MKSDNVIKKKRLHVGEDFYDELINGLQKSQLEESKVEEKDNSKILTPKQRLFLQKYTAPIILEEANKQGFLRDVMQRYYDKEKYKKEALLKFAFDQSMLQYGELSKEVDEISEEGSGWKGFDFFKGSSQIWKVINVARHGLQLYNDYKKFKDKFKEKNLFLEDQKQFKIDEFSAINGGPEGVVNRVASRLDQSVERYSRPLGFVIDKVGRSVIQGVDGLYEYVNDAIYGLLIKIAVEEAGWAALSLIAGIVAGAFSGAGTGAAAGAAAGFGGAAVGALGGAAVGALAAASVQVTKYAVRGKRFAEMYSAIGIVGRIANRGYKMGRAARGSLRVRRVVRGVNRFGESKIGNVVLKTGGFVTKHPIALKRIWQASDAAYEIYDLYNVDSKEVAQMERRLQDALDEYRIASKVGFINIAQEIQTIDNLSVKAMKSFTSEGYNLLKPVKKSELIDWNISKKYNREITIRGLNEIEIFDSLKKIEEFFNNKKKIISEIFTLPVFDGKLSVPDKKFELSVGKDYFYATINGKKIYVYSGYDEIKPYRDVVYGTLNYKIGEKMIKNTIKSFTKKYEKKYDVSFGNKRTDKIARFTFSEFIEKRNKNTSIKLKQENYLNKVYNGASLEIIRLSFDNFPKSDKINKILYLKGIEETQEKSDKLIQINNEDGIVSIKLSDYFVVKPNVDGYNKIYTQKDKELQEEIRFGQITQQIITTLEHKLFNDDQSEKKRILEIIERQQDSKEITDSIINMETTKATIRNYSSEQLTKTRIELENMDKVPKKIGSLIYDPR